MNKSICIVNSCIKDIVDGLYGQMLHVGVMIEELYRWLGDVVIFNDDSVVEDRKSHLILTISFIELSVMVEELFHYLL